MLLFLLAVLPARAISPEDRHWLELDRANLLAREGKFAECLPLLDGLIQSAPDLTPAIFIRGVARQNLRQVDAAIKDYSTVIERDPGRPLVHLMRATAYSITSNWKGVLADCDIEINLHHPDYAVPYMMRGAAYSMLDNLSAGQKDIEAGKALPNYTDAMTAWLMGKELESIARARQAQEQERKAEASQMAEARIAEEVEKRLQEKLAGAAAFSEGAARIRRPVKDKWALIVGISNFADPKLNLKYAAKDARDLAGFLIGEQHFAADHVRLITDAQATRARILSDLGDKWLPRVAGPDDLVLIYFSSHGSPSDLDVKNVNYLIAHDTEVDNLYASGIPIQDLARVIKARVHSDRVIVILDACYSGSADVGGKGLYRVGNVSADDLAQGTGQLVISSSQPNQRSWESKRYQGSVFTKCLIEGLRRDGARTRLSDAFALMKERVEQETMRDRGVLQSPVVKSQWQGGDIVLGIKPAAPRPGLPEPGPARR